MTHLATNFPGDDIHELLVEVERLQTLLSEGDRQGEGKVMCERCKGEGKILLCSDTDAFVCGYTSCPDCEDKR